MLIRQKYGFNNLSFSMFSHCLILGQYMHVLPMDKKAIFFTVSLKIVILKTKLIDIKLSVDNANIDRIWHRAWKFRATVGIFFWIQTTLLFIFHRNIFSSFKYGFFSCYYSSYLIGGLLFFTLFILCFPLWIILTLEKNP